MVGGGAGAVVGAELAGHVDPVGDEVVGVAAEEAAVAGGEGGVAGGGGVGVDKDEQVAAFFHGLGFGGLVVVADGQWVGAADVVDCVRLFPAAGAEVLHDGLEKETDVFGVHDVEKGECWIDHVD